MAEPPIRAKPGERFTKTVRTALLWVEDGLYIIVGVLLLAAAVPSPTSCLSLVSWACLRSPSPSPSTWSAVAGLPATTQLGGPGWSRQPKRPQPLDPSP